jgi:hypothetical protein
VVHQMVKLRDGDIGWVNNYTGVEFKLGFYEDIRTRCFFLQNKA